VDNTRYAHVTHCRQWSNYNITDAINSGGLINKFGRLKPKAWAGTEARTVWGLIIIRIILYDI